MIEEKLSVMNPTMSNFLPSSVILESGQDVTGKSFVTEVNYIAN